MVSSPITAGEFAALMARLGPWGCERRVAVAVSGGADSVCLAWLARHWGRAFGLIVDHGLRADSAAEAASAAATLAGFGMESRILTLRGLRPGPRVGVHARIARYAALEAAARAAGLADLLLGHHAGDQAETVLMRALGGSGPAGLAAMPAIRETAHLRLVRPLLSIAPGRLRACLRAQGIGWAEDPTNRDPTVLRVALRHHLADAQGDGPAIAARLAQSRHFAAARASADARIAEQLARNIRFMPEGYAVIAPGRLDVACLAAIITCLSGAAYAPRRASLDHLQAALAANGAATLGGIRFMPAGRLGPGHLALREAAAVQPPVPAVDGAIWNGVFRLDVAAPLPEGSTLGALGDALSGPRDRDRLPAALRRALPALRVPGAPAAPLHRDHFLGWTGATVRLTLLPRHPASGAIFAGQQAG